MRNLDKFKKALDKKDYNLGLSPIPDWISTGNAALNDVISGDMRLGVPIGRSTMFSGLQGTGKSFLVSNLAKNAQEKGYFVIYVDTEYSVGEGFMDKIGVSLDDDLFMAVNAVSIEEVIEFCSDLFKNVDKEEKVLLIIDSLSNLEPERDITKFDDGKQAFNQGLREKMLKGFVRNINSKCGGRNMGLVMTSHMYVAGQDFHGNPILKPNIGEGTMYIPSAGIQLAKSPLKDGKEISGISVKCKTFKTRYTKLGKTCEFELPWDRGMDFYDGALDVLERAKVVEKNAAWYKFVDKDTGEEVKFQRTNFEDHAPKLLDYYAESKGDPTYEEQDEAESNVNMIEGDS